MSQDKILITGASGFLGSAVARLATQNGFAVRALARRSSPKAHLAGYDIEWADGDLRDPAALRSALRDIRYVFHVAASYRLSLRNARELFESNVDGTRNVMQASRAAGVEKIVYTSSVATLALPRDGGVSDESTLADERVTVSAYKRSKLAAEKLVLSMIAEGLPAVIVNPSTPIGPFDVRPTPTGRIIVEAASGRMPAYVDTGLNLVHVDDVAAGELAALRVGRIGERYILGGQNAMLREMLEDIARRVGKSPPRWRIPRKLVFPIAACAEAKGFLTGREPFATINGLRMAKSRMFFTAAKAERELGFRARPYGEALDDAIAWFAREGRLR